MVSTEDRILAPPETAGGVAAEGTESGETVLEPARIAGLLSAITFPPLLLNVALPGVAGLYTTALLQADSVGKLILLDGLSPDEGHQRIGPGSVMHVHGRLRGIQLDFATRVLDIQAGERPPAYVARMPASVRYHQRRRHFRLRTGFLHDYSMVVLGPTGSGLRGRILDLSAGGLKVLFPRDPGLEPGQRVENCRLSFLGEEQLECGLELIHFSASPPTGELEVGARFLHTEQRDKDRLQRCLTALQRQQLRDRLP